MKLKKLTALFLTLSMLLAASAIGETEVPSLTQREVITANGSVAYPQLSGLADAVIQQQTNTAILTTGQVEERITRLQSSELTQTYEALLKGDVLSVAFSARGALKDQRTSHAWAALNLDLTSGQPIALSALFTDEAAARAFITDYIEMQVVPGLSAHLEASELTPLPETFALSETGVTFYYDLARFATLSGYAGKVHLLYTELRDFLDLSDGSVLSRIGVPDELTLNAESARRIRADAAAGMLPGVPAALGGSLQELINAHRMLIDPDYFPGGRFFQMEDGAFRGTFILTDALGDGWAHSVVQGIRADRANFHGLCTELTTRAAWRAVLGEPDASVEISDDDAYAYYLDAGTSDYYNMGDYQLRLHADENGVLQSLFITQ